MTGSKHGFAIDIVTLTCEGRRGWSLIVSKEYWWAGEQSKAIKTLHWARQLSGQRGDILAWLRNQNSGLDRHLGVDRKATVVAEGEDFAAKDRR